MKTNNKNYKVLLIYPNVTSYSNNLRRIIPPFSLMYLAAYLEENKINVSILDSALEGYNELYDENNGMVTYGLNMEKIKKRVKEINPDLVGVTYPFSCQSKNVLEICETIKEIDRNIKIVVGGVHASALSENIIKNHKTIDFVVVGEGEETLLDLVENLNKEVKDFKNIKGIVYREKDDSLIINEKREHIKNINKIPLPARHLLKIEDYIKINVPHGPYAKEKRVGNILTSRGCPGMCLYCASWKFFGRQFRARTIDSIFKEIDLLIKNNKIKEIQFEDDNLTFDKKRAKEIFKRLKGYNLSWCTPNGVRIDTIDKEMLKLMKESGCYQLTFGIESGNKRVLHKVIRKPINLDKIKPIIDEAKKIGVLVHLFFMVGLPTETKKEMLETLKFAKYLNPDSASFAIAAPLPGSDLYDYAIKNNLLLDGFKFEDTIYRKSCMKIKEFRPKEFEEFVDKLNYSFNFSLIYRNPYRFFKKYLNFFVRKPSKIIKSFRKNA
ncbi:MAG: radical SAM protein [Patescibacteria group bacterium]